MRTETQMANESKLAAANTLDVVPDEIPFDMPYGLPISLARAQAVIHAAVGEAKQRNWKMNVAVADSGGNLVAFENGRRDARLNSDSATQGASSRDLPPSYQDFRGRHQSSGESARDLQIRLRLSMDSSL